jgi:dTDP-4-amino-4,6-dideoxygalactose transaminase
MSKVERLSMSDASAAAYVPFARPAVGDDEIEEVVAAIRSGWLTTGPRVKAFEESFALYIGARHAIAVNSCTAGLHLSLIAADVGPGDEVITTPLTFCATANVIVHVGATPVFADVERDSMNLSPLAVADALTDRTRVLLPVHFAGRPAAVRAFRNIARDQGLLLVEDAAHCIEGATEGCKIGTSGDLTSFSFYATKNLSTGEGGMVTTSSAQWASKIRVAALHGMSHSAWARYERGSTPHYDVVLPGFKYNMMDLQAALGLRQLQRLREFQLRRERIWRIYDQGLAHLPLQRPAPVAPGTTHARHLYTVLVDEHECHWTRDALQRALHEEGVGTSVHFRALHLHSYFAEQFGLRRGMFPNAEYISDHTLSLPLSGALTDIEAERVVDTLRLLLSRRRGRTYA